MLADQKERRVYWMAVSRAFVRVAWLAAWKAAC